MKRCALRSDDSTSARFARSGLTLVELVAAMVLVSVLFAAMVSLLRSFSGQQRAVERLSEQRPPTALLSELIRRDLLGARFVSQTGSQLRLVGTIARDWNTLQPIGRQAEVVYRIARMDGESWLMRREVHLDEIATGRSREESVWRGVASLELLSSGNRVDDPNPDVSPVEVAASELGMQPAPKQMKLIVRRDGGEPLLIINAVHHWEDG